MKLNCAAGDKIASYHTRKKYEVTEVGIMHPEEIPTSDLNPGQVGYIACNMKQSSEGLHIFHSLNGVQRLILSLQPISETRSIVLETRWSLAQGSSLPKPWSVLNVRPVLVRPILTLPRFFRRFSPAFSLWKMQTSPSLRNPSIECVVWPHQIKGKF